MEQAEEAAGGQLERLCGIVGKASGAGHGSGERLVRGEKRKGETAGMVMALWAGPATADIAA